MLSNNTCTSKNHVHVSCCPQTAKPALSGDLAYISIEADNVIKTIQCMVL